MSLTLGCPEDHTCTDRFFRVGLTIAADQGESFETWEGPYITAVAMQP